MFIEAVFAPFVVHLSTRVFFVPFVLFVVIL